MKKFGFTMAEAILVMTILGIIATIMIANIKPSEFREQAMQIQAKKIMNELDSAINQMIINDAEGGNFWYVYDPNDNTKVCEDYRSVNTTKLYACWDSVFKKYLSISRKSCNDSSCPCYSPNGTNFDKRTFNYLKDGACFAFAHGYNIDTFFPEEEAKTTITRTIGILKFDVNGNSGPNILGKDQFVLPVNSHGIHYDSTNTGLPLNSKCGGNGECASSNCKTGAGNSLSKSEPWGTCVNGS